MLIGKDWKIETVPFNVVLYRRSQPKRGIKQVGERWYPIGFYSSVQNALQALVDLEVEETHLVDLKTVVDKQAELHSLIDGLDFTKGKRCP